MIALIFLAVLLCGVGGVFFSRCAGIAEKVENPAAAQAFDALALVCAGAGALLAVLHCGFGS